MREVVWVPGNWLKSLKWASQVTILLQHKKEIKVYKEGGDIEQKRKFPKTTINQVIFNWFNKAKNKYGI